MFFSLCFVQINVDYGVAKAELHFSEAWFHGNLERGRDTAEQMLYENAHMGDGTFIVRKSQGGGGVTLFG